MEAGQRSIAYTRMLLGILAIIVILAPLSPLSTAWRELVYLLIGLAGTVVLVWYSTVSLNEKIVFTVLALSLFFVAVIQGNGSVAKLATVIIVFVAIYAWLKRPKTVTE